MKPPHGGLRPSVTVELVKSALCTLALVLPLLAQQAAQQVPESPIITTDTSLVLVPVSVVDRKGNLIDGLNLEDFQLTDMGVRQKLRLDTSDTVVAPVSMVVLVQASGISQPAIARLRQVGSMLKPVVAGQRGQVAVIAFDDEVRVFQDFTTDSDAVTEAINRITGRTIKGSKMLDAVAQAVKLLSTRPISDRRLIFLVSEARDRGSKLTLREAREMAERAGAVVYSATYSVQIQNWTSKPGDAPPMPGEPNYINAFSELGRLGLRNAATSLARVTGGRHLSFVTVESLEKAITRMGEEIHGQYLLSFTPPQSKNKGFHQISVTVPSKPEAVVRVREGYWAER